MSETITVARPYSPIHFPEIVILGVFGNRSKMDETDTIENILTPILKELGHLPDKVLLPTEGMTSIHIEKWAQTLSIPISIFTIDWAKKGKAAAIMRDARIQAECTHALVFEGPRSARLRILAERMAKNGKNVYIVESTATTFSRVLPPEPLEMPLVGRMPKGHGRKSGTETVRMRQTVLH